MSIHWVAQGADANGTENRRVSRVVPEADTAYHAGVWNVNLTTVGIECRPEARDEDYAVVAALVREIRSRHGDLPLWPHKKFVATSCPGRWDLTRLDRLARQSA